MYGSNTIAEIKKHTDRPIIVRDKASRPQRVNQSLEAAMARDVHCIVTYNSIAALEALNFGKPAIALGPNCATDFACGTDLSKIETPLYVDDDKVIGWQNWLGYCQFNPQEMVAGTVLPMLREYGIK